MRQMFQLFSLAATIVAVSASPLRAQTTAVGPYYATPSWDQTVACLIPSTCSRFVVLSNFNNEAVLDRETGLVWERTPDQTTSRNWLAAADGCISKPIGGRMGWRLPTVSEMGSLFQGELMPIGGGTILETSLPAGHPFSVPGFPAFWTATPSTSAPGVAWFFRMFLGPSEAVGSGFGFNVWCVRSGTGPAGS